jgi:signal transduction histidine kinase
MGGVHAHRNRRTFLQGAVVGLGWLTLGLVLQWSLPELRMQWWADGAGDPVLSATVMAAGATGSVFRRRFVPVGLLIAGGALLVGPPWVGRTEFGTLLVFTDLLYCAALYSPARTARIVTSTAAVASTALTVTVLVISGTRPAMLTVINTVLIVAVPLLWGTEVRKHRDLAESERARAAEAARAAEREREAAIVAERSRMARDLHDVVAGRLSAIALQTEAALQPGADPTLIRMVLGTVRESGVAALDEMRAMIRLLRDDRTADPMLAPARLSQLPDLVESAGAAGLDVEVDDTRPAGTELPAAVELAGFRIVQEALTNVSKHAPGAPVRLHLALTGTDGQGTPTLLIEVRNGASGEGTERGGPVPGVHSGVGLVGLSERALTVGGTLTAGPDGEGWLVRAELPHRAGGR